MSSEIHIIQSNGANYALLNTHDIISSAVQRGGFEPEVHKTTDEILKNVADGIVLDIGANLGSYTVPVAMKYPHLQVYSFEPQQTIFYQLCTNIFLNRLSNVHAKHCAVSDSIWSEAFEVPDYAREANIGAFSIDHEVRGPGYQVQTRGKLETINSICLDALQLQNIRLVKLDIEGHELQALKGAKKTLENSGYPPIVFESWDCKLLEKQKELFSYLESLGYIVTSIGGYSNYLAVNRRGK